MTVKVPVSCGALVEVDEKYLAGDVPMARFRCSQGHEHTVEEMKRCLDLAVPGRTTGPWLAIAGFTLFLLFYVVERLGIAGYDTSVGFHFRGRTYWAPPLNVFGREFMYDDLAGGASVALILIGCGFMAWDHRRRVKVLKKGLASPSGKP